MQITRNKQQNEDFKREGQVLYAEQYDAVEYLGKLLFIFTLSVLLSYPPNTEDIDILLTAITSSVDAIKSKVPSDELTSSSHTRRALLSAVCF
jgi:hypothetical protein